MILGTCSGAGKSLITTAICRHLLRKGEQPLPFKGQNMSNNAWVDDNNYEMAYSQAIQAFSAGLIPTCEMNPVLLKPQGDCTSEVIHLGKSVGVTEASKYYEEWFDSGWQAIQKGLKQLEKKYKNGRFVLEGAGSPVEINLQHRDLTNLKLAKYLSASCILVADIERGGVFAQLIGTLALLKANERKLIKGIIINRFRGDISLFDEGREWIEKETKIPVLGIMPWLNEIFPPEDSLDLLERKRSKPNAEIKVGVIKLPSMSNFSDLDPLEAESSIQLQWITPGDFFSQLDAIIIPGSKQTIKDLIKINNSGLAEKLKVFAKSGGHIFAICGGLQMLGKTLNDPLSLEQMKSQESKDTHEGLNLLPIKTYFKQKKSLTRRKVTIKWPQRLTISGFEMHHGVSTETNTEEDNAQSLFNEKALGWYRKTKNEGLIAGSYLHGIFENGAWRRSWINFLREKKGYLPIPITCQNHNEHREKIINKLTDSFEKHINMTSII